MKIRRTKKLNKKHWYLNIPFPFNYSAYCNFKAISPFFITFFLLISFCSLQRFLNTFNDAKVLNVMNKIHSFWFNDCENMQQSNLWRCWCSHIITVNSSIANHTIRRRSYSLNIWAYDQSLKFTESLHVVVI